MKLSGDVTVSGLSLSSIRSIHKAAFITPSQYPLLYYVILRSMERRCKFSTASAILPVYLYNTCHHCCIIIVVTHQQSFLVSPSWQSPLTDGALNIVVQLHIPDISSNVQFQQQLIDPTNLADRCQRAPRARRQSERRW